MAAELEEQIIAALRTIHDPELPVNVYDLGLIYHISIQPSNNVSIDMTLTNPNCPAAGEILDQVKYAVEALSGTGEVEINLVFDPPYTIDRMPEHIRLELGLY